jgi:dihydrofolate reductase
LERFNEQGEDYGYAEFMSTIDATIMGSRTYEQVLTFPDTGQADDKKLFVITKATAYYQEERRAVRRRPGKTEGIAREEHLASGRVATH